MYTLLILQKYMSMSIGTLISLLILVLVCKLCCMHACMQLHWTELKCNSKTSIHFLSRRYFIQFNAFSKSCLIVLVCLHPKGLVEIETSEFFYISHTLRSWLHLISTWIGNLSPGLEKNGTLDCCSDNFPTLPRISVVLQNCQNYFSLNRCSPIQGTRSLFLLKVRDRFVL